MISVLFSDLGTICAGANFTAVNQVNLNFQSVAGTATITFDNFCTGDASGCIGGATTTPVPEPGTWALLAAGLGLLAPDAKAGSDFQGPFPAAGMALWHSRARAA